MNSPQTTLEKQTGITPAERYLKSLCDDTFLSLWSFPRIYRDQGVSQNIEKEVCDLLVVFGNTILIFSDKACEFPRHTDVNVAWKRWFKRAIAKSAAQAWGAERWIREHPDRLFLDPACKKPFPFDLPSEPAFHLIVVAHHVADAYRSYCGGGSGSLRMRSDLPGTKGYSIDDEPFVIGDLDSGRTFVHVLDDTSLRILMQTLDTISDFVAYLTKKERLFRSPIGVLSAGEEELLSLYLKNAGPDGEHDFIVPPGYNVIVLDEGMWEEFSENPQRLAQIDANRVSYAWDKLIEKFSFHAVNNTQHFASPRNVESTEKILRFMAAEPRTCRRMLAGVLLEMLDTTPIHMRRTRVALPLRQGGPFYVFLLLPRLNEVPYEEYRELRYNILARCSEITKLMYPAALDIVGIATETGRNEARRSEDALYLDAHVWTEEQNEAARKIQAEWGFLTSLKMTSTVVKEYPDLPRFSPKGKIGRNDRCPCGSGKKFKKCCGSPESAK